jgi:hypothetical protein
MDPVLPLYCYRKFILKVIILRRNSRKYCVNSLFYHNESKHLKLFEELSGQPEESYEYYRMTPETHLQHTTIKIKNAALVFTDFFFSQTNTSEKCL